LRGHLVKYLADPGPVTTALQEELEAMTVRCHKSFYVNVNGAATRVVASKSFHGKERFDCVSLRGTMANGTVATWYARILLIFRITVKNVAHRLVYLHYFSEIGAPAGHALDPFRKLALRLLSSNSGVNFAVTPITSIRDVCFIAPDFKKEGAFHHRNDWVHADFTKSNRMCFFSFFFFFLLTQLPPIGRRYNWTRQTNGMDESSEEDGDSEHELPQGWEVEYNSESELSGSGSGSGLESGGDMSIEED
jgi:hypothetical protein